MKIVIIDGQGGRIGGLMIEKLSEKIKSADLTAEIIAIGTNSIATAAMLKSGADAGATGENPVIVACRDADFIVGPIGIIAADSLLGEVTAPMAAAITASTAVKVLLPVNKCSLHVVGSSGKNVASLVEEAVDYILKEALL